jgi:outer membrane lipoprotein-sorting protein
MKRICKQNRWVGIFAAFLLFAIRDAHPAAAEDNAATVTPETRRVLDMIDQTGKKLVDLAADFKQTKVTLVVNDTSTESGKLYLKRTKSGNRTRIDYENIDARPEEKTLLIDRGKVLIYEPRIKRLQPVELGKSRGQAEFLLTGIGQSSSSLTQSYDVKFLKEEMIESAKASLLELKPKSEKVSSMFSTIWIWVDHASGLPIQTRLTESSGDYLTFHLENIRINPKLDDKIFKLDIPSDVQRMKPLTSQ